MKNVVNKIMDNLSVIIRGLCSVAWCIIGLACLFACYMLWNSLRQYDLTPDANTEQILMGVALAFGILFLLYAAVQFTRGKESGLAKLFRKRVPNVILVVLAYGIHVLLMCFLTQGEVSLKQSYAVPYLAAGAVLLFLDLCVNLELCPDQWDESFLIRWVEEKRKKRKK